MSIPKTVEEFEALRSLTDDQRSALGMHKWDVETFHGRPLGIRVWLFPERWYNSIPTGFIVTDIFRKDEPFKPGVTDDDTRGGMLAFGIKVG